MSAKPPTLDEALALHRAGRAEAAQDAYRAILARQPGQPDALHGLGVLCAGRGALDEAQSLVSRAIEARPGAAAYHNSLGNILQRRGAHAAAEAAFRRAIALDRHLAQAHANLGHTLRATGRHDEAVASCRSALALAPTLVSAWAGLGQAQLAGGACDDAVASFETALAHQPGALPLRFLLGTALLDAGAFAKAETHLAAVAAGSPTPEALCNLGRALIGQGRCAEAVSPLESALRAKPGMVEALFNLAIARTESGDVPGAVTCYEDAVAGDPSRVAAWRGLGAVRLELGDTAGARAALERALAIAPADAQSHGKLGLALLTDGVMPRGWHEYEWRWKCANYRPMPVLPVPLWDGGPLQGSLLLHAEQGFGDTIQFCRYAPFLARRGCPVVLECQPELLRLFARIEGIEVVPRGAATPPVVAHCPLMSVPARLGTTLDTIPSDVPYLVPDPEDARRWANRLEALGDRRRVGLVWAGNPNRINDHTRSLELPALGTLIERHDVAWISLQTGGPALPAARYAGRVHDWTGELVDFAETAALIAGLDLVIAADTAVAHLAAAMGKPTWILLPVGDVWRWMLDRSDSPWYPTATLFRQSTRGEWSTVVAALDRALGDLAPLRGAR